MTNLAYFIAGIALGWWLGSRQRASADEPSAAEQSKTAHINKAREERREENKEKIIAYLREHGTAKNDDLEEMLGVSDATVTNYMDELEREGMVVQKGETSQTYYELA